MNSVKSNDPEEAPDPQKSCDTTADPHKLAATFMRGLNGHHTQFTSNNANSTNNSSVPHNTNNSLPPASVMFERTACLVPTGPHLTDADLSNAKAYLCSKTTPNSSDLYSHLVECLRYIFQHRPQNALDNFESISEEVKLAYLRSADWDVNPLMDVRDHKADVANAAIHKKLFPKLKATNAEDPDPVEEDDADDEENPVPDMQEMSYYFEQIGVGVCRSEMLCLWASMKKFCKTREVEKIRFWGKVLGTEQDYYILEVTMPEEEEEPEEEVEENEAAPEEPAGEEGEETKKDKIPVIKWKPPPKVPPEERGRGLNRYTFYVCNVLGGRWKRLPDVTPQQIHAARLITKLFTGRSDAPVISHPPFPGCEINLLRAQIARIHAATIISPVGFYNVDEDEELEEDEVPETVMEAEEEEYEALPVDDLADPSQENWVHHTCYILPQGRVQWIDAKKVAKEAEEEEQDEEEEEEEEPEPEEGPQLLAPISEDAPLSGTKEEELTAWRVEKVGKLVPKYAICAVHSNRWPGAHAFAAGKKFENVYVGWGVKYNDENHIPLQLPLPQKEFPDFGDTALIEAADPTPEEERAFREAQKKAEEEGGEEGKEEEDEEAEED